MADEDADYADEDYEGSEDDEKLHRVEEHSGSTEYLSTEDEGEAGAPAAGAVFASGLDALMSAADAMPSEPLEHRTRGLADRRPRGRPPRPTPYDDDGIRKCAACGTTSTPKWRCAMTLCNACGLRNSKRVRARRAILAPPAHLAASPL